MNEVERLFGRAGVRVDGACSGVQGSEVVLVVVPNDPADEVDTCKRVADYLFAAVRTIPGVTVKVISSANPRNPLYELAA